jgi:hypothetical protein
MPEPRDRAATLRGTPNLTWGWRSTDAAGGFELEGLLPRDYRVIAMDPATLLRAEAGPFPAGARGVRIVLPARSVFEKIAGRVVSRSGEPVAGVRVTPMTDAIRLTVVTINAGRSPEESVVTDASGAFAIERMPRQGVYLRIEGDAILPVECGHGPGGIEEVVKGPENRLEVTVSLRVHVRVELAEGTAADGLAVLDRHENPMQIHVFHGHDRVSAPTLPIASGRTDTFSVAEDATTLVLRAGKTEVRRIPLALRPGAVNVLRL